MSGFIHKQDSLTVHRGYLTGGTNHHGHPVAHTSCRQSGWLRPWQEHPAKQQSEIQPPFELCGKCFPRRRG
jgi:hypothetical protein